MSTGYAGVQIPFNDRRSIVLPTAAQTVAAGDLNNDKIPDLVIGRYPDAPDRGNISVLLGNGNGTFQPERKIIVGLDVNSGETAPYITDIVVADLNNDNQLDIVVSHNETSSIINFNRFFATILLGNGDGTFAPRRSYYFFLDSFGFLYPGSLVVGDFDRDGDIDIYVCGGLPANTGVLYPLMNLGNGVFQVVAPQLLGLYVYSAASADFNQDGKLDAVVATPRGSYVIYGDGNLYFTAYDERDTTRNIDRVQVGDFNSDGKPDYASVDRQRTELRVFVNSDTGFPTVPKTLLMKSDISRSIATADFNGDHIPDLAVPVFREGKIRVLYGRGDGSFQRGEALASGLLPQGLAAVDLDLDGKMDLVATNTDISSTEQVHVYLNAPNPQRYYSDFDGDRKADIAVYRPSTGAFWILQSKDLSSRTFQFGIAPDAIVPGNYDGDNKADLAVFRGGLWYYMQSTDNAIKVQSWGTSGDIPVPADYNNDGIMEFAVFRPATGTWYISNSSGQQTINWGQAGDMPVVTDYDGDGRADVAVYRPSNSTWYILLSSNNQPLIQPFGQVGDKPVPADYDGDGRADIAIYRPSAGAWYILQSSDNSVRYARWGISSDIPVPKDYDGDGKADFAVYRNGSATGVQSNWFVLQSSDSSLRTVAWGTADDVPLP